MAKEVQTIKHPKSGKEVTGILLERGDVLQATDVYGAESGEWQPISSIIVGTTVSNPMGTVMVRPSAK